MNYILDDNGDPVPEPDVLKWAKWIESAEEKRVVEQTHVNGYFVSTVFLGVDQTPFRKTPVLFETMIFKDHKAVDMETYLDKWREKWQGRWETREEAQAGHVIAVAMAKKMPCGLIKKGKKK